MEVENVQPQVEQVSKQSKVWSMLQINIASFIGGSFCGCYLVSKNDKIDLGFNKIFITIEFF
ncbi:MAG: hypothetical protein KR126chlam6_00831 [Candidatus Anoxychlamydiales bacterium]|nr:hypothetical protein [Candidatus Anoxychlamydiales bacterium]